MEDCIFVKSLMEKFLAIKFMKMRSFMPLWYYPSDTCHTLVVPKNMPDIFEYDKN